MLSNVKRQELIRDLLGERLRGEQRRPRSGLARPAGPVPLSFANSGCGSWIDLESGSAEYNAPVPMRLDGVLDVGTPDAALDAVVVRMRFCVRDWWPRTALLARRSIRRQGSAWWWWICWRG